MHELSLCEGIMQIIEQQARSQKFSTVKKVILDIGVLSGVETSALEFSFEVVMQGTVAQNAQLIINHIKAQARCTECTATFTINQRYDACPQCGSFELQISSGDEMKVKELEVD